MYTAKFEHIATGYPQGVGIPLRIFLLAKIDADLALDWIASKFGVTQEDFFFLGVVKS